MNCSHKKSFTLRVFQIKFFQIRFFKQRKLTWVHVQSSKTKCKEVLKTKKGFSLDLIKFRFAINANGL